MRLCPPTAVLLVALVASPALGQTYDPLRRTKIHDAGTFSVTVEGTHVFERDLSDAGVTGQFTDDDGITGATIPAGTRVTDLTYSGTYANLRLAYSIAKSPDGLVGIEVFGTAGVSDLTITGAVTPPAGADQPFNVEGDTGPVFGLGFRGQVWERDNFAILTELHVSWETHASNLGQVSNLGLDLSGSETAVQHFKSQLLWFTQAIYMTYRFDVDEWTIAPYVGVNSTFVNLHIDGNQAVFDPGFIGRQDVDINWNASDNIWAVLAGVEFVMIPNVSGFVEVRAVEELTLNAGISITF